MKKMIVCATIWLTFLQAVNGIVLPEFSFTTFRLSDTLLVPGVWWFSALWPWRFLTILSRCRTIVKGIRGQERPESVFTFQLYCYQVVSRNILIVSIFEKKLLNVWVCNKVIFLIVSSSITREGQHFFWWRIGESIRESALLQTGRAMAKI